MTIRTRNSEYLFGDIVDGEMVLNGAGWIARRGWQDIPVHFPHVELDEWVIMPNHLHGIVTIRVDPARRGTACRAPTYYFRMRPSKSPCSRQSASML